MATCLQWGSSTTSTCATFGTSSVSSCTSWGSTAVSSCAAWGTTTRSTCSSWGIFSFLCLALTWIVETVCLVVVVTVTAVCLAVAVVTTVICLAWAVITTAVCLLWDLVTTIAGFVFDLVEAVLGWAFSLVAAIVDLIFSIPFVGRFLRWLWDIVLTVVWGLLGVLDSVAYLVGIRPQKKLRICTLIERDAKGPVAAADDVVRLINDTIGIYLARMNVQILNSAAVQLSSGFSADGARADGSWVQVLPDVDSASQLDLHCGAFTAVGFGEDLGPTGSGIQLKSLSKCFFGNWRRTIGYGAPVVVLVVRSIDGGLRVGCGFGPLTDYVSIASFQGINSTDANKDDVPDFPGLVPVSILAPASPSFISPNNTLAHEVGHVCNLWHLPNDPSNLMFPFVGTQSGTDVWQEMLVRGSRHVSYL